ncbi:MAG: hypothetical protein ABJA84_01310, partial [Polaromonas sp.]
MFEECAPRRQQLAHGLIRLIDPVQKAMSPLNVEILVVAGKNEFSAIGESKVSTFNGDIAVQNGVHQKSQQNHGGQEI